MGSDNSLQRRLIPKYADAPEGRAKELIARLPLCWQEALTITIGEQPGNIAMAALFPDMPKFILPADPMLRAVFEEMTSMLLEEVFSDPNHYLRDAYRSFPKYR